MLVACPTCFTQLVIYKDGDYLWLTYINKLQVYEASIELIG